MNTFYNTINSQTNNTLSECFQNLAGNCTGYIHHKIAEIAFLANDLGKERFYKLISQHTSSGNEAFNSEIAKNKYGQPSVLDKKTG